MCELLYLPLPRRPHIFTLSNVTEKCPPHRTLAAQCMPRGETTLMRVADFAPLKPAILNALQIKSGWLIISMKMS